jgi:hypothetical protein
MEKPVMLKDPFKQDFSFSLRGDSVILFMMYSGRTPKSTRYC